MEINSGIFLTNDRSPTFSQVVQVSGLGRGLPKTAEAANRPKSLLRWWHAQLWQLSRGRMEERGAHHGKATCNVFRLLMTRRLQCYLLNHMWLLTIACTIPAVSWRWRRNRNYPSAHFFLKNQPWHLLLIGDQIIHKTLLLIGSNHSPTREKILDFYSVLTAA